MIPVIVIIFHFATVPVAVPPVIQKEPVRYWYA